jgi:outer membrane receptor protein involved in Fe transport
MRYVRRLWVLSLLAAAALKAQPTAENSGVVHGEPIVVEDSRLSAEAGGSTRVSLEDRTLITTPTMSGLSGRIANFHVSSGGAGSFGDLFSLRGLSNTPYFSDPAVTVYLDDLPLPSSFTYPNSLFGFASATLWRGSQGSTFGRAGEAGVLVFQSADATAQSSGELRGRFGNFDSRSAALVARSARADKVDANVTASFDQRDGYIQNTQLNQRVDDTETASASARFRFRPTSTSEWTLQLLGSRQRNGAQPLVPLGGPLYSVARGREGETGIDAGGAALKGSFQTEIGTLSSTASYTEWSLDPFTNRLVLPPPLDSSLTQRQRAWNEELRLASDPRAARAWLVGAWFSDTRTHSQVQREIPNLFPIEGSQSEITARTFALFANVTLAHVEQWTIEAGLRAEQAEKDFTRHETIPAPGAFSDDRTFRTLLPKLTARYAFNEQTNATLSVSTGARPGGWSAYTDNLALARFNQERTVAFEAGVDTTLANKTVTFASRVFAYSIRDYQIERSFNETDYLVVNAPRARAIGGELEATWRPLPGWSFAATLGVTDITLRKFVDPFTGVSYAGNRSPYVPTYDANLSATFHDHRGWFATAEVSSIGKTFYDESENPSFAQKARTTANARFGFDAPRWRVSVFGENLFDAHYYSLIVPGVGHGVPGAPRMYGVEAAIKW